jgi:hypothetical protein
MPDLDANQNGLAGAGTGGGVEPAEAQGALAVATSTIEGVSAPSPAAPRASSASARDAPAGDATRPSLANYLDIVALAIATPLALALGAPVLGFCVGVGGWLAQRALAVADRRLIVKAAEPGSRLGLNFIDAFGRIWLLAGAIIIAGVVGGRRDGLAAALLIFAAYSFAFAVRLARGRPGVDQR